MSPSAESAAVQRPPSAQLIDRFQQLVKDPMLSAAHVRRLATSGSIGAPGEASLRSLYWRIYLGVLSASPAVWPDTFRRLRQSWTDLHDYLRAPDGTWVDGAKPPSNWRGMATSEVIYNPLGDESGNPWPAWYEDLELRRIIKQDVDRTFPDNPYFRSKRVKDSLTNILFCFAKLHVDVSYRQGMHEILAIIFWCTDMDSIETQNEMHEMHDTNTIVTLVLSRDHVEHDAFTLFNVLMTNMLSWYDPNLSVPVQLVSPNGYKSTAASALVQPIVAKCARIHDLLKKVDFELWKRMEEFKIEPQIYGIRWLRLLFSREFAFEHTLVLWDVIFAEDLYPPLHIADYVCLAMLLRIRESLLDSDYSTFLHGLLRYPMPADGDPRILLIIKQAGYLRDNPTNFGGAYVRRQNAQLGAEAGAKTGSRAAEAMYNNMERLGTPLSSSSPSRQQNASATALIDQGRNIAEGLYGRAEALGINKAVYSALGDLKKSVQSYQAQQAQSTMSEIPRTPSWEINAAMNKGSDLKKLRQENVAMGNALAASLRILQAELGESGTDSDTPVLASLRTIEHIKDVLTAREPRFDPQYANNLVNDASQSLLSRTASIGTANPHNKVGHILDQKSPTIASTALLAPTSRPASQAPATPAAVSPRQTQPSSSVVPIKPVPMPAAPQPIHRHNLTGNHTASTTTTFPDLGDWPSIIEPVTHPLSGTPILPRMPPTSRMGRVQPASYQPYQGGTPLESLSQVQHRHKTPQEAAEDFDPLGALF